MLPVSLSARDVQDSAAQRPADSPEAIRKSAQDFEGLLVEQMMQSMRGSGWLGSEEKSGESIMEFAEQQLSQLISQSGGLGLARLIEQGLKAQSSSENAQAVE